MTSTYLWVGGWWGGGKDTIQPIIVLETIGVAGKDESNDEVNVFCREAVCLQVQGRVLNSVLVTDIVVICP